MNDTIAKITLSICSFKPNQTLPYSLILVRCHAHFTAGLGLALVLSSAAIAPWRASSEKNATWTVEGFRRPETWAPAFSVNNETRRRPRYIRFPA